MTDRVSRPRRLLSVLAATTVGLSLIAGTSVKAAADPDAVKRAEQKLKVLEAEGVKLQDEYTKLAEKLEKANVKASRLKSDIRREQQGVLKVRSSMAQLAQVQYQTRGIDATVRLLAAPDDTAFIRQLGQVQNMQLRANGRVQSYQATQAKLQQTLSELKSLQAEIAGAKAAQAELLKEQAKSEAEARKTVARLTKEEQARLAKLRAEAAAREAAETAAREARTSRTTTRPTTTRPTTETTSNNQTSSNTNEAKTETTPTTTTKSASSRGQIAVNYALSKVGGPYVHGGNGPRGFDCSGLTSAAWRAAGISLPRTASGQYGVGTPVSLQDLQPGDLVFYYSGISHVGIYIGNGKIVDAANPRRGIRITTVTGNYMPYMGARRVG